MKAFFIHTTTCKILAIVILAQTLLISTTDILTNTWASESNSIDSLVDQFTRNLKSEIQNMVASALNNTSNDTSSSIIVESGDLSINNIKSGINSTGGITSSQIVISNGVCDITLVGGNQNNTLSSYGNCNDQLVGGQGADRFYCSEGVDVIRDYNPAEGDIIVDERNCETIL